MFRQQSFCWPRNLFILAFGFPEIPKRFYRSRFMHENVSPSQIAMSTFLKLQFLWSSPFSAALSTLVSVAAERICPDFLWHLSKPRKNIFVALAGIFPSGMKFILFQLKITSVCFEARKRGQSIIVFRCNIFSKNLPCEP